MKVRIDSVKELGKEITAKIAQKKLAKFNAIDWFER